MIGCETFIPDLHLLNLPNIYSREWLSEEAI